MDLRAVAISCYAKTHSATDTERLIDLLLNLDDTPRDDKGHFYKEAGAPCPHDSQDITEEYKKNATPGKGKFSVEPGVKRNGDDKHEVEIGQWLHSEFGGDIIVLEKKNNFSESDPDYLWKGKLWDLKTPEKWSKNNIDGLVHKGIKQIRRNPGGLIVDLNKSGTPLDVAEKDILGRMRRSADFPADIVILYRGGDYKVLRYINKSSSE